MNKTIKITLLFVFIISICFFAIWAYMSNLTFGKFGVYWGIIGSTASIIGLFVSIFSLSKPKLNKNKGQNSLISIKKNTIENSTFGNIEGGINIGDNQKDK